jgi:hypothetical protein
MATDELTAAFLRTPAMMAHVENINAVENAKDWSPATVCIEIDKPLLAMLEAEERTEAAEQGRDPKPVEKILALMMDNVLQEELHWHVVQPMHFARYRRLWNRYCDEHGAPERKIREPGQAEQKAPDGPF